MFVHLHSISRGRGEGRAMEITFVPSPSAWGVWGVLGERGGAGTIRVGVAARKGARWERTLREGGADGVVEGLALLGGALLLQNLLSDFWGSIPSPAVGAYMGRRRGRFEWARGRGILFVGGGEDVHQVSLVQKCSK